MRRRAARAFRHVRRRPGLRLVAGAAAMVLVAGASPVAGQSYREAARLYDGGELARAADIFRDLARDGHVAAQVSLAGLYANGDLGAAANFAKAVHWYRQAANAGDATAQMNLGAMLADGQGVARDRVMAWVWLERAAAQGRDWAGRRADALADRMTPAQRERARERLAAGL